MSLNFFHRPPNSPRAPNWLRKFFLKYLTPVLFPVRKLCDKSGDGADLRRIMDCNGDVVGPIRVTTSYHSHQAPPSPKLPAAATRRLASHYESCADADMSKVCGTTAADGAAVMVTCATCNGAIRRHLGTISEDLHSMIEDNQEDDEKAAVDNEWKQIAHAFDRFCLLLFIVATIILAIILKNELNKGKTD